MNKIKRMKKKERKKKDIQTKAKTEERDINRKKKYEEKRKKIGDMWIEIRRKEGRKEGSLTWMDRGIKIKRKERKTGIKREKDRYKNKSKIRRI